MVATIGPPSVTTWVLCLLPAHTCPGTHCLSQSPWQRKGLGLELHLLSRICRWLLPENASSAPALPSSSGGANGDSSRAPLQHTGPLSSEDPGPRLSIAAPQHSTVLFVLLSQPLMCPSSPSSQAYQVCTQMSAEDSGSQHFQLRSTASVP